MKNKMYLNVTLTFLFACLMAGTTFAQFTDNGTYMITDDNVNIGATGAVGPNTDLYSLYVRKDKAGWQGRFANRSGAGADVYLAHGSGYGMSVIGRTDDNKYTLKLARRIGNSTENTNVFYNDGVVALGLKGKVGVGILAPAAKLHVKGLIRSTNSNNLDNYIELNHGGANSYINHVGVGRMDFRFEGSNKMVLTSGGNLGIGIDTPTQALEVNGNIKLPDATSSVGSVYCGGVTNNGEIGMRLFGGNINGFYPGGFIDVVTDDASEGLRFRIDQNSGTAEKMRIRADGKVVIGNNGAINTPGDYKLYVDNGILTEKVKVATVNSADWADYVFEEDYDLNSTDEVEIFIKANKHLPNVPSAKAVSENGIDMVEMDATLLRQIEELWLHVIELKKEIQTLETELEQK